MKTYARNGRVLNNQFTANFPGKIVCKSVKIWQHYGHEFVASLFWPTPQALTRLVEAGWHASVLPAPNIGPRSDGETIAPIRWLAASHLGGFVQLVGWYLRVVRRSMGFIVLATCGLRRLRVKMRMWSRLSADVALRVCIATLLLSHACRTMTRNAVWRHRHSLFTYVRRHSVIILHTTRYDTIRYDELLV